MKELLYSKKYLKLCMLVKVFLYHPIYRKVINLQKALCDYLEGGYPDIDMEDTYLFRSSTIIYSSYISINLIFIRSYRS